MKFFIGGFSWGQNGSQLERFLNDGIWQNGYGGEVYHDIYEKIKPGDLFGLKSTYVVGKKNEVKKSALKIVNIGIVNDIADDKTLRIKWLNTPEQRYVDVTWFSQALVEITDRFYIDLIFGAAIREIDAGNILSVLERKRQIILQGAPGTGKTYTAKDIAEKLISGTISADKAQQAHNLNASGRFKLVQFHPSYTYDDFVRGIVIENIDDKILYTTKDKPFLAIANDALKNLNDSRKSQAEVSYEQWVDEQIELFKEYVTEIIESKGAFALTDNVAIRQLDDKAFIYHGDDWTNKISFKDLKQAFIDNDQSRQDIKHDKNLSRSAFRLATYYYRLLKAFRDYLESKGKNGVYTESATRQVDIQKYVIIIDEINRANLPAVLGELIYALEYRNEPVDSPYAIDDSYSFTIPENLYVIGTMNTADRSVGQIDYAIRRRFSFVHLLPQILSLPAFDEPLFKKVSALFIANYDEYRDNPHIPLQRSEFLSDEFCPEDVWLGHSYFIMSENDTRNTRLDYEIKPILREYVKDGILKPEAGPIINSLRS